MTVLWALLNPPPLKPTRELEWVLARAFGPVVRDRPSVDTREALRLAKLLGVRERIAARNGERRLEADLGRDGARELVEALRTATVAGMRLLALARTVADVAADRGIPLVFSKFLALHASGTVAAGARPAVDVDIVAPRGRLPELQATLVEAGLVPQAGANPAGHLPPLNASSGGTVELHWALRGVRVWRGRFATLEDLSSQGLLERANGYAGSCWLPTVEVRLAHLLVHAFRQHGWDHEFYPLLRAAGDLQDTVAGRWEVAERSWLPGVHRLLPGPLNAASSEAAFELVRRLESGERSLILEASANNGPPETLALRHVLGKALDRDYARRIRFLGHFPLSERSVGSACRAVLRWAFPSPARLEARHGRKVGPVEYASRLLTRPIGHFVLYGRSLRVWSRPEEDDGSAGLTPRRQEGENPPGRANERSAGRRDGDEDYPGRA